MQDTNMPMADNAVVDAAVTGKKPLSEAQKAGLAKAREKAREKKLALSKQKADAEKKSAEEAERMAKLAEEAKQKPLADTKSADEAKLKQTDAQLECASKSDSKESDATMTDAFDDIGSQATDSSEPSPSPMKLKHKGKKQLVSKRPRTYKEPETSEEESSEDAEQRARRADANHASLTRAAYEQQLQQYKSDLIYKQLFSYLYTT